MINDPVKREEMKKELKEKTVGYITAAFGLVAGLAWNDAIGSLIETVFPLGKDGVIVKFIYAVVVTVFLVFITRYIVKLSQD